MRTAGIVYVPVVQAQVHDMGNGHQRPSQGHGHGMRDHRMVQWRVQDPPPQRRKAQQQKAKRAERTDGADSPTED